MCDIIWWAEMYSYESSKEETYLNIDDIDNLLNVVEEEIVRNLNFHLIDNILINI